MFNFIYNLGLLIVLMGALPRLFQKKYRTTLLQRLGLKLPRIQKSDFVIWIHAISMGETRAVIPLFQIVRKKYPNATILISNSTDTGHKEAMKSMKEAAAHFLLPFDFSWIQRRAVAEYKPDLLVLVESDFWYNLIRFTKKRGGKVILINGKISERSARRFQKLRFFAQRLFNPIDRFCLQNATYAERFTACGVPSHKCSIPGNIKFDFSPIILTEGEKQKEKETLGIIPDDRVVVIGSTHPKEEEILIASLKPVLQQIPSLKLLLVPRHPERFTSVEAFLATTGISFAVYSKKNLANGTERILLIDTMGLLNKCYQLAEVAIVAGSFVPGIGGHNILEPTFVGVPVLFGPYMCGQPDLVDLVLASKVGYQIPAEKLSATLLSLLQNPSLGQEIQTATGELTASIRGSTGRTFEEIEKLLKSDCL